MKTSQLSENNHLYRPQIMRSIFAAKEMICEDVAIHIRLSVLARQVWVNESTKYGNKTLSGFITTFKKYYHNTPKYSGSNFLEK